jgi:MFS family permease
MSFLTMAESGGMIIGPVIAGLLSDSFGISVAVSWAAVMALCSLLPIAEVTIDPPSCQL